MDFTVIENKLATLESQRQEAAGRLMSLEQEKIQLAANINAFNGAIEICREFLRSNLPDSISATNSD